MEKTVQRIAVYGGTGQGKSVYVKNAIKNEKRIIVLDPLDEYSEIKGFQRATSISDIIWIMRSGKALAYKIAYVPPTTVAGYEILHHLSCLLMQTQRVYKTGLSNKKVMLVVEEASNYCPSEKHPAKFREFTAVLQRGRHYGIDVITVSQGVTIVSKDVRRNLNEEVFFRLGDEGEMQMISRSFDLKHKDKLSYLHPHDYIHRKNCVLSTGKNRLSKKTT